jgi:microcystin-dependent protein
MAIKDYSTEPDMNTTISGINIAEGCPPSGINNAIRQLMADVKAEKDERDAAQAAKDAQQDAAISSAQSSADAAQSSADAAQSSADAAKKSVPVGTVIAFAANSTPDGFLLCNGAAVSRSTYASLFSAIGTTYGAGDGSSTFALPNLTDRFIQGSGTVGTIKEAGLPEIAASSDWGSGDNNSTSVLRGASGAFLAVQNKAKSVYSYPASVSNVYNQLDFSAKQYNSVYGNSDTVQPPALTMRYYIKY